MRTEIAFIAGLIAGYLLHQVLEQQRHHGELAEAHSEAIRARSQLAQARQAAPPAPIPQPVALQPDDLTRIRGIGPVFQKRLQEAGIRTFAQLAGLRPERLREIVATAEWQKIEPERWIAEAAQLAAG